MEDQKALGPVPVRLLRSFGKVLETTDLRQLLLEFQFGIWNESSQGSVRRLCRTLIGVHFAPKFLSTKDFAKPKVESMSRARLQGSRFNTMLADFVRMLAKLHRKQFVNGRALLPDAEFLSQLAVRPELHRFTVAAREALARVCSVPASSFYPADTPAAALKLLTFDWDDVSVAMELEAILGFPVDEELPRFLGWRFFWRGEPGPQTIGEWCVRVAEHLQSRYSENHVG